MKEIGVIEQSNPYSGYGQQRVCDIKYCLKCKKAWAFPYLGNEPIKKGKRIISYTNKENRTITQQTNNYTISTMVHENTPIVTNFD
jgi:hypothetical protein